MAIYDYNILGLQWPRDKRIIEKTKPSHGNGVVWIKTEPEVEPVTLDEFKVFAKINHSVEDSLIETFLVAARRHIENELKKILIETTLVLSMDYWPDGPLKLPRPPLLSVVEVRTLSEEEVETVYSTDSYYVRTGTIQGQVVIKTGSTPPINTDRYYGGYEVEYKAGYGENRDDVPDTIRHGIMLVGAHIFETRTPIVEGTVRIVTEEVPGLKALVAGERRIRI